MKINKNERKLIILGRGYNNKFVLRQRGDGILDIFKVLGRAVSRAFFKSGVKEGVKKVASNVAKRVVESGKQLILENKDRILKKATDVGKKALEVGAESAGAELEKVIRGKRNVKGALQNVGLKTLESAFETGQPVFTQEVSDLRDKIKLQADAIVRKTAKDLGKESNIVKSNIESVIEDTNLQLEKEKRKVRGMGMRRLGEGLLRLGGEQPKRGRGMKQVKPKKTKK
tara:strand:- start:2058 stop:2741 length:684 start_codon:yes stop_codon:yes gene_type:complete